MRKSLLLCVVILCGSASLYAGRCCHRELKKGFLLEALPEVNRNWSGAVGILAEQMYVTDLPVMTASTENDGGSAVQAESERTIVPIGFNLDLGIRVSLEKIFPHHDWSIKASFEWLHSVGSVEKDTSGTTYLSPLSSPRLYFNTNLTNPMLLTKGSANLDIEYNLLDVSLNTEYYFTGNFSTARFFGIKAGWINTSKVIRFWDDQNTDPMPAGTYWEQQEEVAFWGAGPMIGAQGIYWLDHGWGIFSTGNIAILLGKNQHSSQDGLTEGNDHLLHNSDFDVDAMSATIRMSAGLQYEYSCFNDTQLLCGKLGVDGRYYVNPLLTVADLANYTPITSSSKIFSGAQQVSYNSFGMFGLIAELTWYF